MKKELVIAFDAKGHKVHILMKIVKMQEILQKTRKNTLHLQMQPLVDSKKMKVGGEQLINMLG